MKTVYLHIGLHKTGTTSIQNFLFRHRGLPAETGIDILKPCLGPRHGHHNVAWSIYSNHPRFNSQLPCLEDAAAHIEKSRNHRFLLSSEEFSPLDDRGIHYIGELLGAHRVVVILFIRNQADLLASMYAEAAKKSALPELSAYVAQKVKKEWQILNYAQLYRRWAAVFGAENMEIQVYETQENAIAGLLNALKAPVEPDKLQIPKYNESLNTRFTLVNQYLITKFNRLFPDEQYRDRILGPLIATAKEDAQFSGRTHLCSAETAQAILNRFKTSNQQLAAALELDLPRAYFVARHRTMDEIGEPEIEEQALKLLFNTIKRQQKS